MGQGLEAAGDDFTAGNLFSQVMDVYVEESLARNRPECAATLDAYDACVARLRPILAGTMAEADVRQDEALREVTAERDAAVAARQEVEHALTEARERMEALTERVMEFEGEIAALKAQGDIIERLQAMVGAASE